MPCDQFSLGATTSTPPRFWISWHLNYTSGRWKGRKQWFSRLVGLKTAQRFSQKHNVPMPALPDRKVRRAAPQPRRTA